MRGTVLRLRSDIIDSISAEDGSSKENHHDGDAFCVQQSSSLNSVDPVSNDNQPKNVNKNTLMTNLDLCSTSATYSSNIPAAPLQRPVFEWNDESMWKAMSRHPLFPKYMELQSQLNSLFEEIRMDCKRAACEKAFASLVKETADSPIVATSVESKLPMEIPRKRKGRPPLKRKPGRPRKYVSAALSPEWNSSTSATINKHPRKCRDELFLSRKPSWICQNCARRFSSAGWLDRHQSFCSFSKLSQTDSQDVNECLSQTSKSEDMLLGEETLEETINGAYSASESSDTHYALSSNRSSSSKTVQRPNSPSLALQPTHTAPITPLKPKMENLNCTEDEEGTKRPMFEDEGFVAIESSVVSCEKCGKRFTTQARLQRHWEGNTDCNLIASHCSNEKESGSYSSDSSGSSCKHCGKFFIKRRFLKRHQSMCHPKSKQKLWQCTQCFKAFSRHLHFEQHQQDCTSKKKYISREVQRCENCSMLFPTQKKLLKHQAICCPDSNNHMIKLLKCLKCAKMFPSYKRQLQHRAVCCPDSDTDAMVCRLCCKVFLMHDRMAAHKKKCLQGVNKKMK